MPQRFVLSLRGLLIAVSGRCDSWRWADSGIGTEEFAVEPKVGTWTGITTIS